MPFKGSILLFISFFFTFYVLSQTICGVDFNDEDQLPRWVKIDSIIKNNSSISFIITDLKQEIVVSYSGLVPNLFSEGKGVVAEGKLKDKKYFVADKILAKHDENYMPPEVIQALENVKN